MRKRLSSGWMEIILGILLILLGMVSFIYPDHTLTGIIVIYGVLAVITGIADLVIYAKIGNLTGFGPTIALISGTLSVLAGMALLFHPGAGKWILSLLFPIWFITHCLSKLSHLNLIRFAAGNSVYHVTLILNVIGLVLGFMLLFEPVASLVSLSYLIGIYLVLLGADSLVTGISRVKYHW